MCVKILENNVHKDIIIKEGELFLLPARIPHSPQRTVDSCGLVIERRRELTELDGVRWFIPNETNTLYEKWFHCKDLGKELVPLIREYFSSEEHKTKKPASNIMEASQLPFELNKTLIDKHGPYDLTSLIRSSTSDKEINLSLPELKLQFEVTVLKKGEHKFNNFEIDHWLWQFQGASNVCLNDCKGENFTEVFTLILHDSLLVPTFYCKEMIINVETENDFILKVSQNPKLKV